VSKIIEQIEKENLKPSTDKFEVGDTVKVYVKVVEGAKERLQGYEGVVIAKKNGSNRETFTVRRISYGVGVERTFPLHSPRIDKVEVFREVSVRRAKLYYLRDLTGKAAKVAEKKPTQKDAVAKAEAKAVKTAAKKEAKTAKAAAKTAPKVKAEVKTETPKAE
jgi:large subunit ribosomal protein L19